MMRASIVGTRNAWVICSSRATRSHSAASKRGSGTMRRPAYVLVRTAVTPAMWNGGTATSTASSSPADANSIVLNW